MKLVTFLAEGKELVGVRSEDGRYYYPISALGLNYRDMNELVDCITDTERGRLAAGVANGCAEKFSSGAVKLCAPIPIPKQDLICLGENYMDHAKESFRYQNTAFDGERPHAAYFGKRVNRAVTDGDSICSHAGFTEHLDYEAELAVVIGKDADNVSEADALDYVFGYMVANDVSARDIQYRYAHPYFGKSLNGFAVLGPWLVTADEIPGIPALRIQSWVNGEARQDGNTSQMIFQIPHIISELSHGFTLKAGSIILTGTPAGVGMGYTPPRFLQPGDLVECCVEGLGSLKNRVE